MYITCKKYWTFPRVLILIIIPHAYLLSKQRFYLIRLIIDICSMPSCKYFTHVSGRDNLNVERLLLKHNFSVFLYFLVFGHANVTAPVLFFAVIYSIQSKEETTTVFLRNHLS